MKALYLYAWSGLAKLGAARQSMVSYGAAGQGMARFMIDI